MGYFFVPDLNQNSREYRAPSKRFLADAMIRPDKDRVIRVLIFLFRIWNQSDETRPDISGRKDTGRRLRCLYRQQIGSPFERGSRLCPEQATRHWIGRFLREELRPDTVGIQTEGFRGRSGDQAVEAERGPQIPALVER
jgi:hypothetical protein